MHNLLTICRVGCARSTLGGATNSEPIPPRRSPLVPLVHARGPTKPGKVATVPPTPPTLPATTAMATDGKPEDLDHLQQDPARLGLVQEGWEFVKASRAFWTTTLHGAEEGAWKSARIADRGDVGI
jgi:hypothetical protein